MTIAAGRLNEKVTVQRPVTTTDDVGGQVDGWETFITDRAAEVRVLSARPDTEQEALQNLAPYQVTMRLAPVTEQIVAGNRIIWRGRELFVQAATPDRLRWIVTALCELRPQEA